ncbi:VRR-NUC domain-containing protein [Sandaracinomonas limnophila]|uniref:phosphodiesterase I n=1 Tax=Sandaracinomonas limnophila TaxID=1862386 RepID=A0A437PXR4_9BACT|nr:VRR-NUC domain-containing protein [Sandaracinomonas limnophila]RVU27042.1 VRR-NUC domain-containing protein [Sandaracinomonas limnophila]
MDKIEPNELPKFYYWNYFGFILNFIKKHYVNLLNEDELHFLSIYEGLPFTAQCLLIRLGSRKPNWFQQNKLHYSEIENLSQAFEDLKTLNLIQYIKDVNAIDLQQLFQELTKEELFLICKDFPQDLGVKKSYSKEAFLQILLEIESDIIKKILEKLFPDLFRLNYRVYFDFFQFLFFGSKARDLTEFVVKDLGFRQFFEIQEEDLIPYFSNRQEAIEKWKISNWNEAFLLAIKQKANPIYWIQSWNEEILPLLEELTELSYGSFERSVMALGRNLERSGFSEEALEIYQWGLGSQSLERRIRILQKLKRTQEAITYARLGLELFTHPNDRHFYQDFLGKFSEEKVIKQVTQKLKKAEIVEIEQDITLSVEAQVANYYISEGFQAAFTENRIWKNLMGILAWDILFDAQNQTFSHPFQMAPSQYRLENFGLNSLHEFRKKLDLLQDLNHFWDDFNQLKALHEGTLNPLLDWQDLDEELLKVFLTGLPTDALITILEQMWLNISTHSKGFPDLMVWSETNLFFVEVKSPNDHLSPIQFFWNELLNEVGIESKIVRIKWIKN